MSAEPVVSKYTQALPGNLTSTWTVMGKATRRGHPALWLIYFTRFGVRLDIGWRARGDVRNCVPKMTGLLVAI